MVVHSFYVINRSGSLIFSHEHSIPKIELEKTFSYPLDFVLKPSQKGVVVDFGQRDGIKVGHTILSINGIPVRGNFIDFSASSSTNTDEDQQPSSSTSRDIIEYLSESTNYPGKRLNLSFFMIDKSFHFSDH
jgi:cell shape-determining protein MreC